MFIQLLYLYLILYLPEPNSIITFFPSALKYKDLLFTKSLLSIRTSETLAYGKTL
jgi:hypothetical protein